MIFIETRFVLGPLVSTRSIFCSSQKIDLHLLPIHATISGNLHSRPSTTEIALAQ